MAKSRELDVVIYGATGFTGRLVTEYFCKQPGTVRWAVAGRSSKKLDDLCREFEIDNVRQFVADSNDFEALGAMCSATKVVLTTVGPYAIYGSKLVEAAVKNQCHYVDLTGETPWMAEQISKHDADAKAGKTLIIHSCGADSIPSDLTTYLGVVRMKDQFGASTQVGRVRSAFKVIGGGFSGGTFHSLMGVLGGGLKSLTEFALNPYCLSPVKLTEDTGIVLPRWLHREGKDWGGYYVISSHNLAIVQRTRGLLKQWYAEKPERFYYGDAFDYDEFLATPGPVSALLVSIITFATIFSMVVIPPLQTLARKVGPSPGTGPSKKNRDSSKTVWRTTLHSVDDRVVVQSTMSGDGDPGYKLTSIMLAESALTIALERDQLSERAKSGGFLTPATALGSPLARRLGDSGFFRFDLEVLKGANSQ